MTSISDAKNDDLARTDPRRLRELMDRVVGLAEAHDVGSVVVGVAGRDGDLQISEFMDFIESALRMEDSIFRMTRERSVLFLADVDRAQAEDIVDRLMLSFAEQTASPKPPSVSLGFSLVEKGPTAPLLRDVLLEAFPARR
ncbi:MAG: hypothetical protein JRH10_06400 [Deltaproteobacteria bacterium]|nr:hypothetical protein [Deltaproteobacteria bacterium]